MDAYSPVLRPAGCLEQPIDMHGAIASTLSKLRSEWASWISFWSFLVHLNDLDFYKELDEELEIRIAPSASCHEGVYRKRTWPQSAGDRFVNFFTEIGRGIWYR